MITRSPRSVNTARARSATALKFTAAATRTGSAPLGRHQRRGAVRGRQDDRLAGHRSAVISRGELPNPNPSILTMRRSPAQYDAVLLQIGREADGFLGGGRGDHGFGACRQRGDDAARRAEDVDDDDPRPVKSPAFRPSGVK